MKTGDTHGVATLPADCCHTSAKHFDLITGSEIIIVTCETGVFGTRMTHLIKLEPLNGVYFHSFYACPSTALNLGLISYIYYYAIMSSVNRTLISLDTSVQ